jgi:5-methylcytosine-specific restriction endonuclease McrA
LRRYTLIPYVDDPTEQDAEVETRWELRQREQLRNEEQSVEVFEQDDRKAPKHIQAKVGKQNERARRKGSQSGLSQRQWRAILRAHQSRCAYCGEFARLPILEHVVPMKQGGGTTAWNVVPACRTCNSAKRDRDPIEWLGAAGVGPFFERVLNAAKVLECPTT